MRNINVLSENNQLNLVEIAQNELLTQEKRREKLLSLAVELFSEEWEILSAIEQSFNVPQLWSYHNEGILMDTHLNKMVEALENVKNWKFLKEIPEDLQLIIHSIVGKNYSEMLKYIFLHDISKKDTLNIKYSSGESEEVTWIEWCDKIPSEIISHPPKLLEHMKLLNIGTISYFQKSNWRYWVHWEVWSDFIKNNLSRGEEKDLLEKAIRHHEDSFLFKRVNVKLFEKKFSQYSVEELMWCLSAAYLDIAWSVYEDGSYEPSSYMNWYISAKNYHLIKSAFQKFEETSLEFKVDKNKMKKIYQEYYSTKSEIIITESELIQDIIIRLQPKKYDRKKVENSLRHLQLVNEKFDEEIISEVLSALDDFGFLNTSRIKKVYWKLKADFRVLQNLLSESEVLY